MTGMADKGAPRTARERIKTLAQAALNADLTAEQVDTVLNNRDASSQDAREIWSMHHVRNAREIGVSWRSWF